MSSVKYTSTKIACYSGFVVQAIVNNFLPILFIALNENYGIGYEKLGRLIMINFVTQLVTDTLTPKIVAKIGYRKAAVMCQGTAALGLVMLSVLPRIMSSAYTGIVISILVYAFSSGLMEVILSPMVEMLPTGNKSGNMALLHSFYCWGQAFTTLVTTFLVFAFGYGGWGNIPLIWAVIPLINMLAFLRVPIVEPEPERKSATLASLLKTPKFWCFMVIMFCAGASEIAMAEWASMFAQQALGVSKVVGDLAGPCAFALCMGTGRVVYAHFSERISFRRTIIVMSALCAACYFMTAFSEIPALALVSCALCGFTVSLFWPGTYSAGARAFPKGDAVMFSVFAMCGDLGCCLGPYVLGLVADRISLHAGFAVTAVFPIILFVTALFFFKEKACQTD